MTKLLGRAGIPAAKIDAVVDAALKTATRGDLAAHRESLDFSPTDLIPIYQYWPITGVQGGESVTPSQFADAGSLDNTGIASALAYSDVDNVISFLNTMTPISQDASGNIVIDDALPPLFGYQPYDAVQGYVPYSKPVVNPANAVFANNQIFAGDQFLPLLQQLWTASGSGTYQSSPIAKQTLTTQANPWFGVAGGKSVSVLWVYLESTLAWSNQLPAAVADIEAGLVSNMSFPHYSTMDTELDATEINLLANLAAWTVISNQAQFTAMYGATAAR